MKFLLEFVSCCGVPSGRGGGGQDVPETVARLSEEETRALVEVRKEHRRRKKRGRGSSTAGNNNSGVEWKPTLGAISENNVVVEEERGVERAIKRKGSVGRGGGGGRSGGGDGDGDGGGRVRDIASLSSYVDNYRRNRVLTVIPAFSPTPFMI